MDMNHGLLAAAEKGHVEQIQALLSANADIEIKNLRSHTPLTLASSYGHIDAVRALIDAKANIEGGEVDEITAVSSALSLCDNDLPIRRPRLTRSSHQGNTPLLKATCAGHVNIVALLISAGANIHALTGYARSALMLAAEQEKQAIAFKLISATSPEERQVFANTSPQHAALLGQYNIATSHYLDKKFLYMTQALKTTLPVSSLLELIKTYFSQDLPIVESEPAVAAEIAAVPVPVIFSDRKRPQCPGAIEAFEAFEAFEAKQAKKLNRKHFHPL